MRLGAADGHLRAALHLRHHSATGLAHKSHDLGQVDDVGAVLRDIGIMAPGRALVLRRLRLPAGWVRPVLLSLANALRRGQHANAQVQQQPAPGRKPPRD